MKRIIRIRRHAFVGQRSNNILSEFQPIWSWGYRPGTRNTRTTHLFFTFRLSHQGRHRREINFLYNNRTMTVNMEQVQISRDGARKIIHHWIKANKPLFHVWSQNSKVSKREIIFWFTILTKFLTVFQRGLRSFRLARWLRDRDRCRVHPASFLSCKTTLWRFPLI